jgi:hypothetical protein
MAEAHERSAYHRFKTADPLYDFTRMDPDDSDLAWTGPSPIDQPYDYLKSKERAEYYAEKEKRFCKPTLIGISTTPRRTSSFTPV